MDRRTASRGRPLTLAALIVASGTTLMGCVVAPAYPGYYAGGYEEVTVAPPAPRYEVVGVAPYPGWFWIGGYWTWRARSHVWVGGHWEAPRNGYYWQPHRWEPISGGRGWRERPGQWMR